MNIRIVTDSTCDLPQHIIEKYHISVVPLYIYAGNKEYRDGIDITRQEFYERLPGFNPPATTAAPGIDAFRQVYDRLASEGADHVLSIHISIELSGVMDVVRKAAEQTRSVPVTVFDSRQLSLGTGFEVLRAAQAAEEGHNIDDIIEILNEQIMRTHVFAALDTLEFLRRSGRMNFAVSALGNLLRIKPFLKMYDGNPTAERVRTRRGACRRLIELFEKYHPYEKVALLHAHAVERAQLLLREVKHLLPEGEVWLEELNPILGSHLGPGVIGFACISQKV